MKNLTQIEFFQEILPLAQSFKEFWIKEISPSWPDTQSYVKSLFSNSELIYEFADLLKNSLSHARTKATLVYLDQYTQLRDKFSSFTEFSVAAGLTLSHEHFKNSEYCRLQSAICQLDLLVSLALSCSECEWLSHEAQAQEELAYIKQNLNLFHPALQIKQQVPYLQAA